MPQRFTCPHCESELVVEDKFIGKEGPCNRCGKTITIHRDPQSYVAPDDKRPVWPLIVSSTLGTILFLFLAAVVTYAFLPVEVRKRLFPDPPVVAQVQIQQIAQALLMYHDDHGSFPPAFVVDDSGKPLYSWRVLILPQLGEAQLYGQFKLNEPWDSANNLPLVEKMPEIFASANDPGAKEQGMTSYLVPLGGATLFPGALALPKNSVADNPAGTLLVIQSNGSGIFWSEPRDFLVAGKPPIGNEDYKNRQGFFVANVNGEVALLPAGMTVDLKAFSSVQGGEKVEWEKIVVE